MNIENIERENENDAKHVLETGADINAILYESKFFQVYALGTNKGLQIRKIRGGKKPEFEDMKMELVFLSHMIKAKNIYSLDSLMVQLVFIKMWMNQKNKNIKKLQFKYNK